MWFAGRDAWQRAGRRSLLILWRQRNVNIMTLACPPGLQHLGYQQAPGVACVCGDHRLPHASLSNEYPA